MSRGASLPDLIRQSMMRLRAARTETGMKALILAFGLALTAIPAVAATITPPEAKAHVGENVTVEGVVSEVHHAASGKAIFLDIGGR
jgi:hypothetical protein